MVSIRIKAKEAEGFGFGHFCGGVLITKSHVLTLGSCIDRTTSDDRRTIWGREEINLAFGSRNRYDPKGTLIVTPSEIKVHPDYDFADLLLR